MRCIISHNGHKLTPPAFINSLIIIAGPSAAQQLSTLLYQSMQIKSREHIINYARWQVTSFFSPGGVCLLNSSALRAKGQTTRAAKSPGRDESHKSWAAGWTQSLLRLNTTIVLLLQLFKQSDRINNIHTHIRRSNTPNMRRQNTRDACLFCESVCGARALSIINFTLAN